MRKTDLGYLIPDKYYSDFIPTKNETQFLYIGQESILFLSATWYKLAGDLLARGLAAKSIDERMDKVSKSQEYREFGDYLQELASRTTSKPLLFQKNPFRTGDRVTCFINKPSAQLRGDLKRANRFLDTIIVGTDRNGSRVIYSVVLRNQKNDDEKPQRYKFIPDNISAISTDDFHYFKLHPNFFRLYLNINATNDSERGKIEPILSAL